MIRQENLILEDRCSRKNYDEIFVDEIYEKANISNKDVWLDAGGFIGLFSIYAREKEAKTYCYEPITKTFHITQQHLKTNIFKKGIWNKTIQQNIGVSNSIWSSSIFKTNLKKQELIDIVDIDEVLNIHKDINCIKLDIEGCEFDVLKKLDFEKNNIKKLICEFHFKFKEIDVLINDYKIIYEKINNHFETISMKNPETIHKILLHRKDKPFLSYLNTFLCICTNN